MGPLKKNEFLNSNNFLNFSDNIISLVVFSNSVKFVRKMPFNVIGDRRCDLTIIGERNQLDKFTEKLNLCFLNDKEIEQYNSGYVFEDPWPKKIAPIKV